MMGYKEMQKLSRLTGLSVEKCTELLDAGWTYHEGVNCTPGWRKP